MTTHLFRVLAFLRAGRPAAALAALALLAGCMTPAINDPARGGPFFVPRNVAGDLTLGGIRRVVLLPVWSGVAPEESTADFDAIFLRALQEQNRFEVVAMSREDCQRRFGRTALSSVAPLPHDMLAKLYETYAADAVMFVDITVFRPYHPLVLGVRGKLATINATRLVWTFDNVFSADDPLVSAAARHFYLESSQQDVPGDSTPAILQSPSRFAAYAAQTTFATLPPVVLGGMTKTSAQGH